MINRLLNAMFSLGNRHGRVVLICLAVLTIGGGLLASRLTINTSQKALIPDTYPVQMDYKKYIEEFGAIDSLIVVLSGEPKSIKAASELFASEFKKETKWVKSIFYKVDVSFFMKRAPLFMPVEALRNGLDVVTKQRSIIEQVSKLNNLDAILTTIEKSFSKPELEFDPDAVSYVLMGIEELLKEWNRWLTDPTHNSVDLIGKLLAAGHDATTMARSEGYLLSYDERMLFLLVQPNSSSDDRTYLAPFLDDMRAAGERVFDRYPNLRNEVEIGFTGMPAVAATKRSASSSVGSFMATKRTRSPVCDVRMWIGMRKNSSATFAGTRSSTSSGMSTRHRLTQGIDSFRLSACTSCDSETNPSCSRIVPSLSCCFCWRTSARSSASFVMTPASTSVSPSRRRASLMRTSRVRCGPNSPHSVSEPFWARQGKGAEHCAEKDGEHSIGDVEPTRARYQRRKNLYFERS